MENYLNTEVLIKDADVLAFDDFRNRRDSKNEEFMNSSVFSADGFEVNIHHHISLTLSSAKKSLPKGVDLTEMLTHMVSHLLHLYDTDREYYRIFISHMLFIHNNKDSIMEKLLKEQLAFIAYVIELSKVKKKVLNELDSHQVAISLFFLYIGLLVNFINSPKMTVEDAVGKFSKCCAILQRGIEKEKDNGKNQYNSSFFL